MKKSDNPRNNSRRSFIKKSVVVSMAASNLTMFSGLVNASESGSSGAEHGDIACGWRYGSEVKVGCNEIRYCTTLSNLFPYKL